MGMVFWADFGLGDMMGFGLFWFFDGVAQGLEYLYVSSVLFEFFFGFHDGKVKFAVGFGLGEELSVVIKKSAQFRTP